MNAISKRKRRILFVDIGTSYGGVETYIESLASIVAPDADIFALSSIKKLSTRLEAQSAKVWDLSFLRTKWMKPLRLVAAAFLVPWLAFTKDIDVLQLNGYFESWLLPILRLLGKKTIYTMHGPLEIDLYRWYRNPERYFPRLISARCLQFATRVVCVSEAVQDVARTVLPVSKVCVIANWVKLPFEGKPTYSLRRPLHLLCVGRVEEYKGFQLVIEAVRKRSGLVLTIAGIGGYLEKLKNLALSLPVNFSGFVEAPSTLYATADVFINPSFGPEGLPLVSLEAMSYGLPCIFSNLPVHCEISEGGNAAALFDVGNLDGLLLVLDAFQKSETTRRDYGLAARRRVISHYSEPAALDKYRNVLLR